MPQFLALSCVNLGRVYRIYICLCLCHWLVLGGLTMVTSFVMECNGEAHFSCLKALQLTQEMCFTCSHEVSFCRTRTIPVYFAVFVPACFSTSENIVGHPAQCDSGMFQRDNESSVRNRDVDVWNRSIGPSELNGLLFEEEHKDYMHARHVPEPPTCQLSACCTQVGYKLGYSLAAQIRWSFSIRPG